MNSSSRVTHCAGLLSFLYQTSSATPGRFRFCYMQNKQTNKWLALIGSVTLRLCHCQMKFMFDCGIFNHHFIFGKQYVFFHLFGVLKYIVNRINFVIISGFVACPDLFTPVFFTFSTSKVLPSLVPGQPTESLGTRLSKSVQLPVSGHWVV